MDSDSANYQMDSESLYNMYILCEGVEIALLASKLDIPNKTLFKNWHLLDHNYAKVMQPEHEPIKRSHDDKENINLKPFNKTIKREPFESIENKILKIKPLPTVSAPKTRYSLSSSSKNSLPYEKVNEYVSNKSDIKIKLHEIVRYVIKILPKFFTVNELKTGFFSYQLTTRNLKRKLFDQTKTAKLKRDIADQFFLDEQKNEEVWKTILKSINSHIFGRYGRKDSKH